MLSAQTFMNGFQPPSFLQALIRIVTLLSAIASVDGSQRCAFAHDRTGEQIFRQQCARCHGIVGEGTPDAFPHTLAGDKTVVTLSAYIAEKMPEDDPGTCIGAEAAKVAEYIHGAFYSKEARRKNRPPVIEVSRLTVRQYRNALADLIGSFRTPVQIDDQRGLHAVYFKSRKFRDGDRVIERRDHEVMFDFGRVKSGPGKVEPSVILDTVGRIGVCAGSRRIRVHRPKRARHAALDQRSRPAADRRSNQVEGRNRVPSDDFPSRRPLLPAQARIRQNRRARG